VAQGLAERVGFIKLGVGTLMLMSSLDRTDIYRHIHGRFLLAMREGMRLLSDIVAWIRRAGIC